MVLKSNLMKILSYIKASCVFLLLLSGCATVQVYPEQMQQVEETRSFAPELGVVTKVAVDEYMAQQQQCTSHVTYAIERPYRKEVGFAYIYVDNTTTLIPAEIDGEKAYCSGTFAYFVVGERRAVCFMDTYEAGAFTKAYVTGTLKATMIDVLIPYTKNVKPVASEKCYNKTLAYSGIESGSAKFTYADEDKATPFFIKKSIEIPFKKGKMTTFTVNGMEVEIHSADKNSVDFIIKSYFVE